MLLIRCNGVHMSASTVLLFDAGFDLWTPSGTNVQSQRGSSDQDSDITEKQNPMTTLHMCNATLLQRLMSTDRNLVSRYVMR
jgi:hypothetical protein